MAGQAVSLCHNHRERREPEPCSARGQGEGEIASCGSFGCKHQRKAAVSRRSPAVALRVATSPNCSRLGRRVTRGWYRVGAAARCPTPDERFRELGGPTPDGSYGDVRPEVARIE